MSWLELKIPPLVIVLLVAACMLALDRLLPHLRVALPFAGSLALIFVAAGAAVCITGILAFRKARTSVDPMRPQAASSLVESGIYRHTRNPMYLGFALSLCALAVFLANPAAAPGPAVLMLYLTRFQIMPEERILAHRFGLAYDTYRKRARRWI